MATELDAAERKQIRKLMRMLDTTKDLAQNASLTGSLRGGENQCIRQYNTALKWYQQKGLIPEGLFEPIPEIENREGDGGKSRSAYGTIGVACALLAAYIEEELEEDEEESDPAELLKKRLKERLLIGGDLRNIGQVIREAMPDFIREKVEGKIGHAADAVREVERAIRDAEREVRHAERASRHGGYVGTQEEEDERQAERDEAQAERDEAQAQLDEVHGVLDEIGGRMDELAARLERGELSSDDVKRLADEMRRLGERRQAAEEQTG